MKLRPVIDLVSPQLRGATRRMWLAEPALEHYLEWLATNYDLVRATAGLLAEALGECARRGSDAELAAYYAAQLADEYGHDRWIEQDWLAAGGDPRELAERVARPAAARLAGTQYYWIRHADPVALVGHIAVLEWHAPSPELAGELMRRTGLPATALRTIARHAELDSAHALRLDRLLARLALTPAQERLVTTSALTTAHGLIELMIELGGYDERIVPAGPAGLQHAVRD